MTSKTSRSIISNQTGIIISFAEDKYTFQMLFRFIKKILLMLPVIFLLAVLVFFLSDMAPGDRVQSFLDLNGAAVREDEQLSTQDYIEVAKSLDLDLPAFYFRISPKIFPDTLYKLNIYPDGKIKKALFRKYPDITIINALFQNLTKLYSSLDSANTPHSFGAVKNTILSLRNCGDVSSFQQNFDVLQEQIAKIKDRIPADASDYYDQTTDTLEKLKTVKRGLTELIPDFTFYGANNRFHKWFGKVMRLDFGLSVVDGQKVSGKILNSLKWTLMYILIAYILTFAIAIPLGIYMARNAKKKISKVLKLVFIAFHSMPLFWLATLAVVLFTTSEITGLFNIFPSTGIGDINSGMSLTQQFAIAAPHLILPSLVIAIHSGAYLGTLISRNMMVEMKKKYFLSLLSRGLSEKQVILKHIFPNSILPLITLIVVSLPASLAGSVITEVIFNIPGMGRLLYDSLLHYDWDIVFAIVLIIGVATYIAYMAGDIMYSFFNPKIKFGQ